MSLDVLQQMHSVIRSKTEIDDIYFCPHDDEDNCSCRKPRPGMIESACEKWGISAEGSFLVGDQGKDVVAGKTAGCTTFLINTVYNNGDSSIRPDHLVSSINEAIDLIQNQLLGMIRKSK